MSKIVIPCLLALLATMALPPDPADAARRRAKTARVAPPPAPLPDTYYYLGTRLPDRARSFFGSPVRGHEFFEFNASRATQ